MTQVTEPSESVDTANTASGLIARLEPWQKLAGWLIAAATVLWAVISYLSPLRPTDVTIVSQDAIDVQLPSAAGPLQKLALTYDGRPVQKISIVPITIVNSGREAILVPPNAAENEWVVAIRNHDGKPIERVGELVKTPRSVRADTAPGPTADVVLVKTGLLNAGESLAFQLAVIGGGTKFSIEAEEAGPRIPNLRLAVTTDSVQHRIQVAFLVPLWVVCSIAFGAVLLRDRSKRKQPIVPVSWPTARDGLIGTVLVAVIGAIAAAGLSWGISWIVYLVAFR